MTGKAFSRCKMLATNITVLLSKLLFKEKIEGKIFAKYINYNKTCSHLEHNILI